MPGRRRTEKAGEGEDIYQIVANAIWQQLAVDPDTLHNIAIEIVHREYAQPTTVQVLSMPLTWELGKFDKMGYGPKIGPKGQLVNNQLERHRVTPMSIATILLQNVVNMPELLQQMSSPLVQPEIAFYELAERLAPFIQAALGEHYVYPQIYTPIAAVTSSPKWGRARRIKS